LGPRVGLEPSARGGEIVILVEKKSGKGFLRCSVEEYVCKRKEGNKW